MRALFCLLVIGCSSSKVTPPDLATADLAVDKAARCASAFGSALTAPYGRLDGTVLAIVPPGNMQCPRPNSDHIVLEVSAAGAVYRMVVNVLSDVGPDTRVLYEEKSAPLADFSEGWHAAQLDYVTTLGAHKSDFSPHEMAELVTLVSDRLALDAKVSVFASTSGGDSAHLVHRNATDQDGAIVIDPTGSPTYLLFAFADQTF
jgi:hypothetical protein